MKSLGIDIGSSSIKGAVLDLQSNAVAATVTRPFPAPIPGLPQGWFEISPPAIEQAVHEVLTALIAEAPDSTDLFCSGQMGGVILLDAAGKPLSNYLSWRDQRTLGECPSGGSYLESLRRLWQGEVLQALGNELQPGSTTSLLYWLARNQLLPPGATPATVADFVLSRSGNKPPSMNVTQAIGMLDLNTSAWHHAAFDLLELGDVQLPQLSQNPEPAGTLTIAGNSLRVFGAFGDQQCSLRGAGLQREELSINVSTGSQVSQRVTRFQPGQYQTRRFFDGDWLNTVTHLPAGRSLNVLVDLLTELARAEGLALQHVWDSIVRLTDDVDATDLQANLAFFAGPLGSSGTIQNITTENFTVGTLFQAAFQNMADNYARAAEWIDPQKTCKSIAFSGGLVQSIPRLRSLIQQRFPIPTRESTGDETMLGLLEIAKSVRGTFDCGNSS